MGNGSTTSRSTASDDSDVYVTLDSRSVILDLPDDGRVSALLPARSALVAAVPSPRLPSALSRAS